MTGCASMGFASADLSAQKLKLVQPVLDKTPDGAVGYWKLDDQNFGLVAVDSTMRKAQTTCRLVRENEVRGGNATHLVASYCREGKGAWQ
jgi:surface antigen